MRLGTIIKVWKRIDKIEGLEDFKGYEVNNLGEVRSLYYNEQFRTKLLTPLNAKGGYLVINLNHKGKKKQVKIHRLVALTFIPNDDNNKIQVNHIDEDKTNNKVENLEWMTPKENSNHGTRNKRVSKNKKNDKSLSKGVYCLELDRTFSSLREAERQLKVTQVHIGRCCNRKIKTAYGYHWFFIEDFLYFNNINLEEEI